MLFNHQLLYFMVISHKPILFKSYSNLCEKSSCGDITLSIEFSILFFLLYTLSFTILECSILGVFQHDPGLFDKVLAMYVSQVGVIDIGYSITFYCDRPVGCTQVITISTVMLPFCFMTLNEWKRKIY